MRVRHFANLVEAGYVQTETLPTRSVQYEITETGRAAIADG
jgi:DNA-binding MarR family transcriptional regulator